MMIVDKGYLETDWPGSREFVREFLLMERVFCPAFFFGVVSRSGFPVPEGDISSELSAGQFLYEHQYSGSDCRHVCLWGIFLPISSCPNPETRDRLARLPDAIGSCTRNDILDINQCLQGLGPMQFDFDSMDTAGGEALLEFSNSAQANFDWLKKERFEYIVELNLGPEEADRRVTRTRPLEWPTVESFAEWLTCRGRFPLVKKTYVHKEDRIITVPARVSAVFLYENSD